MIEGIRCETCAAFEGTNSTAGVCRLNAPKPTTLMAPPGQVGGMGQFRDAQRLTIWPAVSRQDWCAQHVVFNEPGKPAA